MTPQHFQQQALWEQFANARLAEMASPDPWGVIDIAIDKAYTAASFGLPTGAWHAALASHSDAVRQGLVLRPRFVAFGGGLPIVEDGALIGGIGVSGGSEAQDEQCANAGLDAAGFGGP